MVLVEYNIYCLILKQYQNVTTTIPIYPTKLQNILVLLFRIYALDSSLYNISNCIFFMLYIIKSFG